MEPVWYLPGIATRFEVTEQLLRQALFRETNMMYPELVTRPDIKVFLPPVGGMTVYIWGDPKSIPDESIELTVRVHDECNGSDVFGSDICTCRPYLTHAIEESIRTAQNGGKPTPAFFLRFRLILNFSFHTACAHVHSHSHQFFSPYFCRLLNRVVACQARGW